MSSVNAILNSNDVSEYLKIAPSGIEVSKYSTKYGLIFEICSILISPDFTCLLQR